MIDVSSLIECYESSNDVEIICVDGQMITGDVVSVDDEEESGLGEIGCSLFTPDGGYVGVGISEIKTIRLLHN